MLKSLCRLLIKVNHALVAILGSQSQICISCENFRIYCTSQSGSAAIAMAQIQTSRIKMFSNINSLKENYIPYNRQWTI